MARPFDATTKELLEADPGAWLNYLGIHSQAPIEVVDADLATVSAEADRVFRVNEPQPYLVHVEIQSSADPTLSRRLFRYNALLDYRHSVRVWSVAVLLRPRADDQTLTGSLELRLPNGHLVHDFRFGVVRSWQLSSDAVLNGPLSTLPMALLADASSDRARTVLERIDNRLLREASAPEAARLMASTFLLAGLRFDEETIVSLFFGVRTMSLLDSKILKDSSSYRLLERKIRVEEARSILLDLATDRLGPPSETHRAALAGIEDHDRLVGLCRRVGVIASWDELLAAEPVL